MVFRGLKGRVTSTIVSVLLTAVVWEISDQLPRMTLGGKIIVCGFIFIVSFVVGQFLSS